MLTIFLQAFSYQNISVEHEGDQVFKFDYKADINCWELVTKFWQNVILGKDERVRKPRRLVGGWRPAL